MVEGLAHLVGDYVVQSHWMATRKTKAWKPALAHAVAYTACFLPLTRDPRRLAVIGGTHYLIDRYRLAREVSWLKNQFAPPGERPTSSGPTGYPLETPEWLAFWLMIITDNTMHLVINHLALNVGRSDT